MMRRSALIETKSDENAEQSDEATEAGVPAARPRHRKAVVLGGMAVAGLAGYGTAVWDAEPVDEPSSAPSRTERAQTNRVVVELPTVIVNRTAPDAGGHLRIRVGLAVNNERAAAVTAAEPYLLDMMNAYLPEVGDRDLRGAAGLAGLRFDLAHRFGLVLDGISDRDVLILEILSR